MVRETTKEKEQIVLRRFHQLLRSGKDYSTSSMYVEAGKQCFLAEKGAGDMIRRHYRSIITEEMVTFMSKLNGLSRRKRVEEFACRFRLCKREAILIIGYIWRRKDGNSEE